MKLFNKNVALLAMFFGLMIGTLSAQEKKRIDGVIAVVGENYILESDIAQGFIQAQASGIDTSDKSKCYFLNILLENKLMAHQAIQDSLVVTNEEINIFIEQQTDRMVEGFGSLENTLKAYNKKSYEDFRAYFFDIVRTNKLAEAMQNEIVKDVQISPEEVRRFYNSIPKEELPIVGNEIEMAEIVVKPEVSQAEVQKVIDRLNEIRNDVLQYGSNFQSKAIAYSEDQGSVQSGGLYTITKKDPFVKEFKEVAFSLREGEISLPFETEFGYHIIYLEKIDGPKLTLRHILLTPKPNPEAIIAAQEKIEKIRNSILNKEITFAEAAQSISDRKENRLNGGLVVNEASGDTRFELNRIEDPVLYSMVSNLGVNDVSLAKLVTDRGSSKPAYYRLIQVTAKHDEHPADYTLDYLKIREVALRNKKKETVDKWIRENVKNTYVKIADDYKDCELSANWLKK